MPHLQIILAAVPCDEDGAGAVGHMAVGDGREKDEGGPRTTLYRLGCTTLEMQCQPPSGMVAYGFKVPAAEENSVLGLFGSARNLARTLLGKKNLVCMKH